MTPAESEQFDVSMVRQDLASASESLQRAVGHLQKIGDDGFAEHTEVGGNKELSAVRAYLRNRRFRSELLPPDLFGEPAWDMLLDLYASRLEGTIVSTSSVCIAAAVPQTTALRWLTRLVERGLVNREEDKVDARRANVELTDIGAQAVGRWVRRSLLNAPSLRSRSG